MSGRVAPGGEAVIEALSPSQYGEGVRVGVIGDSGTGKSHALRAVISEYRRTVGGAVVIVDDGGRGGFSGEARADVADLRDRPITGRSVILTGTPESPPRVPDAASVAWAVAHGRRPACLVVDELGAVASAGRWVRGHETVEAVFTRGRKWGLSCCWTTQHVVDAPRAAWDQSDSILCFRLGGLSLKRLAERGYLDHGPGPEVIAGLGGVELPPSERGRFVLLRRGRPWDRLNYRF